MVFRSFLSGKSLALIFVAPFVVNAFSATAPTKVVQWGVVLGGTVDEDKATLKAFQNLPGAKLVAVMDPINSKRNIGAQGTNVQGSNTKRTFQRYDRRDDFLSDERIDAVWIGAPPGQHLYWAMHIASIRHSLPEVENPPKYICLSRPMLGRSADETATMAAALQARKLVLVPAPLSSLQDRLTWIQEAVASEIGDLKSLNYRYTMTPGDTVLDSWKGAADVHGGGVLLEMGPIVLKFLEILLGPLEDVKGEALNRNSPDQDVEDYVWMQAKAGSVGVNAVWDMTRTNTQVPNRDCFVLKGDKHSLRIQGLVMEPVVEIYRVDQDDETNVDFVARKDFGLAPLSGSRACLEQVTDQIRRGKPQVDLKATFRLSSHIDRILKSYYGGRGDDFFLALLRGLAFHPLDDSSIWNNKTMCSFSYEPYNNARVG
eukprot:scaffold18388_cov185-Amphora_coffeaeformis.AAC.2